VNAVDLIKLNIGLEYVIDSGGLLVPLSGIDPAETARVYVIRHESGYVTYFRHDLPCQIRDRLAALAPKQAFNDHQTVKSVLAEDAPCERIWIGKGCYFRDMPMLSDFPDAVWKDGCYMVMVAGKPVARAWSARENKAVAEVAVETLPAFRRRGYGRQVTAAWAYRVMKAGKIAFYSHERDNRASEALARSLGVVEYSRVAEYK